MHKNAGLWPKNWGSGVLPLHPYSERGSPSCTFSCRSPCFLTPDIFNTQPSPCRSSLQLHFIDAPCGCSLPVRLSSYVVTPVFLKNYMKVDPKRKNLEKWIEKLKFSASSQSVKCGTYHSSGKSIVNYCLMFRLHRFLPSASWRCILPSRVFFAVPFLVVLGHLVWRGEQHLACENTCVICS